MILCLISTAILAGCTTERHRVLVTVKNTTDVVRTIEFYIDDAREISTSIEPKASIEREYELSQGNHDFALYQEINGTFELIERRNIPIEADSAVFFELD